MSEALSKVLAATSLETLYPELEPLCMTPGWHRNKPALWRKPLTEYQGMHWHYDVSYAALNQAGRWIGTDLAERRNYLLFNPVEQNPYGSVRTIVSAYQMLKPGEHARAHRHSPNALRLILDAGPGCFTVVDGAKLPMHPGDVLLTPGNCWHSHYNRGGDNAYWIDFLDVPLVHLLEPMFFEEFPAPKGEQPEKSEPEQHAYYFPLRDVLPELDALPFNEGRKHMTLDTVASMPTLGISYVQMQAGTTHDHTLDTVNRLYAVIFGSGVAVVGERNIDFQRGDIIAVPLWTAHQLCAIDDILLLEVSDEPVMRKLGFYRHD